MAYSKPWISFEQQVELLESRGMSVRSRSSAVQELSKSGYYRLSAYWHPFRQISLSQQPGSRRVLVNRSDRFEANTSFDDATALYRYDRLLRALTLDALECVEVALRVDVVHLLGQRNPFSHLAPDALHPSFANRVSRRTGESAFDEWREKHNRLIARSREAFVTHHIEKYGPDLPIWVAMEVMDFGSTSQLFAMMKVKDQSTIAQKYGLRDWKTFGSWLRSLNFLRNVCAHHCRLWNRNMIDQPKLPDRGEVPWCDTFIGKTDLIARPFLALSILRHIMLALDTDAVWPSKMRALLTAFPDQSSDRKASLLDMGCPDDWEHWW